MVPCKHCNTLNSLDSAFCKRCGTGLPEEQLVEAKAELEKVVDEGFAALDQNRLEEAFAIAESANASDPSSTRALSLKASCHERKGQIPEALECAERIVELNPNSELDKIKRNQLRSALAASVQYRPQPARGVAVLAGIATCVLVFCIGVVMTHRPEKAEAATKVASTEPLNGAGESAIDPNRLLSRPGTGAASQPPAQDQTSAEQPPTQGANQQPSYQGGGAEDQSPATTDSAPELPRRNSRSLPSLDPAPGTLDLVPLQPTGPITNSGSNPTPSSPKPPARNDVSGDPAPQADGAGPQPQASTDPGEIHISVSQKGSKRIGSSGSQAAPDTSAGAGAAFVAQGRNQFQIGNYSGAAYSFEQAIKNGGDPISLNQRLGMAYDSLGRKSDAISAYQRAVAASNAVLGSGKGSSRIQAIKDACQQAISNDGG